MYICIYNIYLYMYRRIFFQKELFMGGLFTKTSFHGENFGGKFCGGVVVHGRTYDQIMSREGGAL